MTPSDEFFRFAFSDPDAARELLSLVPGDAAGSTTLRRLKNLKLRRDTFVDDSLRDYYADLLFDAELPAEGERGGTESCLVYILFEHKSSPQNSTLRQLLRYMLEIWDSVTADEARALPPIVAVVVYNGKPPWHAVRTFGDYFRDFGETGATMLDFSPYFVGVSDVAQDRILRLSQYTRAAVSAMKFVATADPGDLDDLSSALRNVGRGDRIPSLLRAVATYLLGASTNEVRRRIIEVTKGTPAEEAIVTIAESLRKEGLEEGLEKGIEQGLLTAQRDVLVRLIGRKFGITPEERDLVNRVEHHDRLEAALDEFAVAETKEQVVRKLTG